MACLHPISWRNRWILTKLEQLYFCDMKKNWLDFGDLDPIFKVTGGLCLKMACLHHITWMNGWFLTKLAQLYCSDRDKNWLEFGDLDAIFKVTRGLRLFENGLSAPYCHMCLGCVTDIFISSEKKHLMKGLCSFLHIWLYLTSYAWVKVFNINTKFIIGETFSYINKRKAYFSVLEKWILSIRIFGTTTCVTNFSLTRKLNGVASLAFPANFFSDRS